MPVLVDEADPTHIVDGNHRAQAYLELGQQPPVVPINRRDFIEGAFAGGSEEAYFNKYIKPKLGTAGKIPKPISSLTPEQVIKEITGVDQTTDEMAEYLGTDPNQVKLMVKDFQDYGRVNSLSDAQVDELHGRFISRLEDASNNYDQQINEIGVQYSDDGKPPTDMTDALKRTERVINDAVKAKTRQQKVLAIDKIMSVEHTGAGGRMLSWGYGEGEPDRLNEFIANTLDWLRNQTKFTAGKIPQPVSNFRNIDKVKPTK
jgi:hypothetical protein